MNIKRCLACALVLLTLAGCASVPPWQPPHIVAPAQWGGTPGDDSRGKKHTISHITLHHGGVAFLRDKDPLQYLRNLQSWSRRDRQWIDIPYHYLIDLDGKIYAGRSIDFAGDTNTEYDPTGHALIVVLGNFDEVKPNALQLDAVVDMMTMLAAKYQISPSKIGGHKDFSKQTVCPGKFLDVYLENGYFREQVSARLAKTAQ